MTWTENESVFIEFRLENWTTGWSWEYSQAHDYITEQIVKDHAGQGLSVDESVKRFVDLNQSIWRTVNERQTT